MKRTLATRIAVLATSAALVAAYVGYRVVSARENGDSAPLPAVAPDPTHPTLPPVSVQGPTEQDLRESMMGSSKSMPFFTPPVEPKPPAPPKVPDPRIFHGSKSAPIIEPKDVAPRKAPE